MREEKINAHCNLYTVCLIQKECLMYINIVVSLIQKYLLNRWSQLSQVCFKAFFHRFQFCVLSLWHPYTTCNFLGANNLWRCRRRLSLVQLLLVASIRQVWQAGLAGGGYVIPCNLAHHPTVPCHVMSSHPHN